MTAPEEPCLHRRFARQAARTPDAPAVTDGRRSVTYRELDAWSSRIADAVLRYRPAVGSRVGLYVDRGTAQVAAVIGVVMAGCAYVPLDPSYPAERVRYMARDSAVDLVVSDRDPSTLLPAAQVVGVDEEPWAGEGGAAEDVEVPPDTPAYVIYTSGSSGPPKGVVVAHRNVAALLDACADMVDTRPHDTWTLFHSYCFDFSVWELWGALTRGVRLAVVPAEVARSPEATLDFLAEHRVTVFHQVPSVFRHLAAAAESAAAESAAAESAAAESAAAESAAAESAADRRPLAVRSVVFGGEKVDIAAIRSWRRVHGPGVEFVNTYGITETTVFTTYRRLPEHETVSPSPAAPGADPERNIGRPLAGTEVELLDTHGRPVPDGELGEIHVAGAQLAQCYLGRPDLTAERYPTLDPAGDGRSRRFYRSGDLAVRCPDGTLEYAGRADDQVKINGYRIEVGEVEAALRGADGVRDVVVVPVPTRAGDVGLVAFYVPGPQAPGGGDVDDGVAARLAARGRATLPGYMLPGRFLAVASIPLGPSGKTDRRTLAEGVR